MLEHFPSIHWKKAGISSKKTCTHAHTHFHTEPCYVKYEKIPVKLKRFVFVESADSSRSCLLNKTEDPQSNVRRLTAVPASKPIPMESWLWAVSLVSDSPDAKNT